MWPEIPAAPRREIHPQLYPANPDRGGTGSDSEPWPRARSSRPPASWNVPALACRSQLLGRILRVVDQHISAMRQLAQILIAGVLARFIIRSVDNGTAGGINPVAQASLRMVQVTGSDVRPVDLPLLRVGHFMEIARGGHHGHVHREIRAGQLRREYLLQAVRPQILGLEAVEMEAVLR